MSEPVKQNTTLPVCPECGSATFWNTTDGIQTIFCISDDCKWKQQICSRQAPQSNTLTLLTELQSVVAQSTPEKGTLHAGWLLAYPIDRWIAYQKKQLRLQQEGEKK